MTPIRIAKGTIKYNIGLPLPGKDFMLVLEV
jgi:hypothetical protein